MKLRLVKKESEAKDTYSFFFNSDVIFDWLAGQYLYINLAEITKQFTISSSSTEKVIQITTRIRKESKFKQDLNNLDIGSQIESRGPFGSFVFPIINFSLLTINCFLAGGIGITPFRSFIKYNIDKKLDIPIYLIYSNSDNEFVFKNELDQWQKENDFIKVHYHNSSESGHLDMTKLSSLLKAYSLEHIAFWSVGPKNFVDAMEDILEELQIPQDHIKTEKFIGY